MKMIARKMRSRDHYAHLRDWLTTNLGPSGRFWWIQQNILTSGIPIDSIYITEKQLDSITLGGGNICLITLDLPTEQEEIEAISAMDLWVAE